MVEPTLVCRVHSVGAGTILEPNLALPLVCRVLRVEVFSLQKFTAAPGPEQIHEPSGNEQLSWTGPLTF